MKYSSLAVISLQLVEMSKRACCFL